MEASLCFALLVFLPAFTSTVALPQKRSAQGHGSDLEIYSFHVDCKVTSRFAHNVLTSRMANRANASREVTFDVELPKHAFISNFSMTIDGKTYVGVVKKKEEAKQQYDQAVSRGHSAGLVKVSGRKMEEFKVSVNIAALSKVTFELTYEELLKRHLGKYELAIKVRPQQLVKHFKIDAHIYEPQGISFLDAHAAFLTNDLAETVKKTLTQDKAHVVFEPTLDQQRKCPECSESILDGEFIIKYDVKREASAGDIQIVNGYFVHYFAPSDLPRMQKNVVFVIDRSGSMHGKKMQQTREALLKILEDIHEDDHFGLITFDSEVSTWKSTLVQATPKMVQQAKTFVGRITDRGATDINAAVLKGVEMLKISKEERKLPERSVSIIILLTDGDPTSGVTNLEQIQSNIKKGIEGLYTLYCLGFGFDVNYNFLEKLALENGGVARRIYESSDSALQLQGFYEEVATPLLQQVELQYPGNGVSDLTENVFRHYYNGSEIVVAGRISKNDLEILSVQIKAGAASSDLTLAAETPVEEQDEAVKKHKYIFGEYIERLWAYLTIQQLLSKIVSAQPEEREALNEKALQLSLNYNFVTSLTSMVVTKPEEGQTDRTMVAHKPTEAEQGDRVDLSRHGLVGAAILPVNPGRTSSRASYLKLSSAQQALPSRHPKRFHSPIVSLAYADYDMPVAFVDYDIQARPTHKARPTHTAPPPTHTDENPRFVIPVKNKQRSVCFEIAAPSDGVILQLVSDADSGITINGELGEAGKSAFQKIGIVYKDLYEIEFNTQGLSLVNKTDHSIQTLSWSPMSIVLDSLSLSSSNGRTTEVTLGSTVIEVLLHRSRQDFLWLKIKLNDFSAGSTGLLGRFSRQLSVKEGRIGSKVLIEVYGHDVTVTRDFTVDYGTLSKDRVSCWVVPDGGRGAIEGSYSDYVVQTLFQKP
ncbi:inter-alpha-trypsin inhibitor heavy chain H3-like isoform X43 [Acipenser ruthenus]|uniref:inter-alpha-trypsin inhibitor heavy chain H3-like isoform X42 n=1 Tax=Acipenser ruthenus TaxID=7906 RepID=UPI00274232A2|nr:inter-alpha-trypsin inhibitor heavy chain H3-like isoform X42 [Acipenser ruthenus]XP_058874261.1 inter-alpha-trypsin inhibitor heavy chain H3-like isoform X43 [Acipenser ruthenus]